MFSFTLDIYCTSVRPGRGIPHMWLSLRFLLSFYPVKRFFSSFSLLLCLGRGCHTLLKPYETNCDLWIWAIQIKLDWLIIFIFLQKPANILVMGEGLERGRVKIGKVDWQNISEKWLTDPELHMIQILLYPWQWINEAFDLFDCVTATALNLLSERSTGSSDQCCYISQLARGLLKGNAAVLQSIFKPCTSSNSIRFLFKCNWTLKLCWWVFLWTEWLYYLYDHFPLPPCYKIINIKAIVTLEI